VWQSKILAGRRNVPLSSFCKAELEEWRSLAGPEFSEYVFPNLSNLRHPLQGGRKAWVSALKKAKIPFFPIYTLCYTFASRLNAAGASPITVSQMLGHASTGIVQTYARVLDDARREAIRKLEQLRESSSQCGAPIERKAMRQMIECLNRGGEMPAYAPGDYVKVEFTDEQSGESEWMWVQVKSCDDDRRLLFGRLGNVPLVHAEKLALGSEIAVSYDNIREHTKPTEIVKQ
jgi:hypothetical protein